MNRYGILVLITLSISLLITGCTQDVTSTEGTDYLLSGYYMMAGEKTPLPDDGASRTSVTVSDVANSETFDSWMASPGKILVNYPEQGQKTYVTVTEYDATNKIYLISARTEYPQQEDLIDHYQEEYYVKDSLDIGTWSYNDPIVRPDGTQDAKYRKTMEVIFKDGSVRKEWIANVYDWTSSTYYATFDIEGDMTIPSDWTGPATDTNMAYSSEVHYYQKINKWISWFYRQDKETFGVRYYTETKDADPVKSSLAFEQTISQKVPVIAGQESALADFLDWILTGGKNSGSHSEKLSETVIRYLIPSKGKKTVVSTTKVVPTFGDTFTINNEISY